MFDYKIVNFTKTIKRKPPPNCSERDDYLKAINHNQKKNVFSFEAPFSFLIRMRSPSKVSLVSSVTQSVVVKARCSSGSGARLRKHGK